MADTPSSKSAVTRSIKQDVFACVLLALVTIGAFWSWLFEGKALYWGDIGLYFLPMTSFAQGELRQGIFPLWNPHLLCGEPFVGDPQVWPLYPSSLLSSFLSAPAVLTVTCVLHLFLAGVFFYLFLARGALRCGLWPALTGAVCYMLGGYVASKAQFPNMLQALAWVPLALLLAERLVLRPGFTRAMGLGAALGLQLLAAHAQVSLLTFYLAGAYALWSWVNIAPARPHFGRFLGWAIAAGLVAAGLDCGQWLPVAQLVEYAQRQTLSLGAANRFYLPVYEWTNFFWPFRFGDPMHGDWRARGNMWETACFLGPVPLLLAAYAVVGALRRRRQLSGIGEVAFWMGVLVASLWLALGRIAGLYILAYHLLPGVKAFHDPARMLIGAAVALPVLAAVGMDRLVSRIRPVEREKAAAIAFFALTLLPLAWYVRDLHPVKPIARIEAMANASVPDALRADPVLADRQGRVFMADPFKTWVFFTSYKRYAEDDPDYLTRWADTLTPNLSILFGLDQAGGYEPEALKSSRKAASLAESWAAPSADRRFSPSSKGELTGLLGQMSVRDVVVYRVKPENRPGLALFAKSAWAQDSNQVWLYRNDKFLPRARCYGRWKLSGTGVIPLGSPAQLALTDRGPDRVEVAVPAGRTRLVVLADTMHPGWQASIGGEPMPIATVDGLFRGVWAPAANHARRVTFVYRPEVFVLGLYVTLVTISLLAATFAAWLMGRPGKNT